jgi:DNA polymerase-3 subunit delta
LAASGGALADEMSSFSMMGGERLVHLQQPNAEEGKAVMAALKSFAGSGPKPVARLLVEAGSLAASSALRKHFEKAPTHALALPCYPDRDADVSRLCREMLVQAGHKIDSAALALLVASIPKDRMILRNEVEKLICYLADQPEQTVSPAHIQAVIAAAGESSLDELIFACMEGQAKLADLALQRALEAGQAPVMIVRALSRHLYRLNEVLAVARGGGSLSSAVAALRPPVFIMHKERFLRQCSAWSLPKAQKALSGALETERKLKSSSGVDGAILGHFVLALASIRH